MIQTLNTYTNTAKTAEIMARYRPIAPKPESSSGPVDTMNDDSNSLPQSIRKSPYLRNVWPHLQARPTRTRKRGRPGLAPPASFKRARTCLQGLAAPSFQATASPPATTLSLQGFVHSVNGLPQISVVQLKCGLDTPVTTPSNMITLPLLPCASSLAVMATSPAKSSDMNGKDQVIDLNIEADGVLEELDFMQRLEGPISSPGIITPRAVRPVGSTIVIDCINEDPGREEGMNKGSLNRPEDVEKEVESQDVPIVVSDSNNKVRLENSAYKELVGQPECCWLDYMPCSSDRKHGGGACKRIGGEVLLQFLNSTLPLLSNGFTCKVKIEWSSNGSEKHSVNAFCEATRLGCNKDYVFQWRFHIN